MCEFTYTHVWITIIQLPGARVTGNYELPNICAGNPNSSSLWVASTLHHSCIYSTMSPQHSKTSSSPCISLTLRWGTYSCLHPTSVTYCGDVWSCPSFPGSILRKQIFPSAISVICLQSFTHVNVHVCFFPFYPYQGVPVLPYTWSWRSGHRETEEIVAAHSCRQP